MPITIADEVWIALATLHKNRPARTSFSEREIKDQVEFQRIHPVLRTGVQWHINLHCVANLAPNPAKLRMLYRLPDGTLRLYRPGDDFHPQRTGRTHPRASDLPPSYTELLSWYLSEYCAATPSGTADAIERDPVLAMKGVGKEVWEGIDADAFVRQLRADAPEPWPAVPEIKTPGWTAKKKTRG
jgi:hypothetical protein